MNLRVILKVLENINSETIVVTMILFLAMAFVIYSVGITLITDEYFDKKTTTVICIIAFAVASLCFFTRERNEVKLLEQEKMLIEELANLEDEVTIKEEKKSFFIFIFENGEAIEIQLPDCTLIDGKLVMMY